MSSLRRERAARCNFHVTGALIVMTNAPMKTVAKFLLSALRTNTVHSLDNVIFFNAMLDLTSWVDPVHH
jgi:hypothetical protein